MQDLIERLRAGVRKCGLHDDNNTELFDIEDANEAMHDTAEALTTAQAEIEALRSLIGDAYETLKRIEQCAGEALVVASAKDACDKIDATLSGSQT